jgi:hypothetical protein|nr:MAG TPA: nuclease [Caudoviricetes sp.]
MAWKAGSAAALRSQKEQAQKNSPASAGTAQEKTSTSSTRTSGWTKGNAAALRAQKQTEAANADLTSKAFDEYRANNNLGFADEADRQSDWLRGGPSQALRASSPEGRAIGRTALLEEQSPTGRESAGFAVRPGSRVEALSAAAKYGVPMSTNVLEQVGSGAAAYGDGLAQKLKASYAPYRQKDEFDRLNEWFDQPRNQELVGKLLEQKSGFTTYAEQGTSRNAASAGDGSIDPFRTAAGKSQSGAKYTDDDLRKQGYSAAEIAQARDYLTRYDAIPEWKKQARRAGNTIGGIADSVAGGAVMTGETGVQSAKNIADTQKNWAKVQQEIKGDARAERLFQLLTDVDMDYNPVYPESRNRDLVLLGYGSEEIRNMRDRLAGLEANDSVDPETSVGYQLYKRGQNLTGAAQSGLSDGSRAVQGAVSSAAENLAVSAINPAAVLPVLSLQGAGDAMGQSMEKGESAGKTLAGGALKFGAGWAINSVGAADLAKTMGSDYAKNTVAGRIADWVRGMAGNSEFAKQYPAIANAVTGGFDNAMQAFVETYADTAIDAALGDADAAKDLFTKEHLLNALESGLSGGASGALGGAVGTALARYNDGDASWRGNAEYYDQLDRYEKAGAAEKARQQRVEEPGTALSALRPADTGASRSSPEVGALLQGSPAGEGTLDGRADSATEGSVQEQTAVNDDPAVHTWQDSATDDGSAETAVISDNLAVQTFAEAAASDSLTGKTIKLFTPEAGNEANRAAFTEVYGVELPDTAAATRRVLREVAAQRGQQNAVENAGERVETPSVTFGDSSLREGALEERAGTAAEGKEYADVDLKVDPAGLDAADEGSGQMRETYGLREPSGQTARQSEVQRQLEQWGVESGKTKAAQDISQKLPANVDADRYAAAASTIYHLAQMDEVKSFDDALRLAGVMDNTALNVNYILDSGEGGRIALNTAYLYGADTKEQAGGYGGGLTDQSASGQGRVYYEGTLDHDGTDMGSRIIELNAAATGTDAVLKNVLQNDPNVRAYVDNETARIFFGDNVSDIFGTVLHEDYHWYNSLDQAGAKSLQDHALTYLAQMDGYESVDEMIRDKMDVYASQKLTYEQAAEELVADAWRGIFATEADFKRWVEFQRGQAEKNAGVRGSIHKVMNRVKNLLSDIISRAKEVLTIDPGNAAALKAKRLAEAQRRTLQDEYFAHAEKAMDTLRAAKENAAALKTESAAEGRNIRFSIQRGADGESYVKIDEDILEGVPKEKWRTTVKQALRERFPNGFERDGWKILNEERGQKEFLWSKEAQNLWSKKKGIFADKMRMAANLDEIIQTANKVYRETPKHEHKGIEAFNRGKIEIQVGPNFYDADVVTAIKPDGREIFYDIVNIEKQKNRTPHDTYLKSNDDRGSLWESSMELSGGTHMESEDSGSSLPESFMEAPGGTVTETKNSDASRLPEASRESSLTSVFKTEEGGEAPKLFSESSIAQDSAESNGNSEPVKKSVRFQLSAPVEVDSQKDLVAVHNLTEENLKEALELGGMPSPSIAVVKAQEGHTKYGPISLVFNSDTIDPMVNRANRIYGSDAWTPTRPNVEYEVHADKAVKLNSELAQLSRQTAGGAFAQGNVLSGTLDMEASGKSPKQLAESLSRNDAVKAAYLADKGETVQVVTKQEVRFTESQKKRYEKIMEALGGEAALRDIVESDVVNGNHDKSNAVLNEVREAEKSWAMEEFGWSEEKAQTKADRLIAPMLRARLENAYEYVTTKDMAGKTVQDTEAMQKELQQKAPDADVGEWLLPKMEGILGKKGIRNEKDPYTRTGNRRSFAQLHNPYTLQNLVEAMNQQNARGEGAWGLSASTLMSTATAEYQNLDEVRADKGRLQQMPEEEYKALLEKADHQIEAVIGKLRSETEAHADNSFEEREILGDILLRAAQGKQTMAAVSKAFSNEGYTISRETAKQIVALYKTIVDIPTGYFEAKPQRAVEFDEVRAAIVPDNASAALLDSLKEKGVTVYEYKAGDDAQRTKVLNQVPNVRFQMAEQADRDAKRNRQRQASRAIADNSAAIQTLVEMMGLTRGVRVSDDSILGVAERLVKASGAKGKADTERVAREMRTLIEYMKTEGADMNKAQGLAETIAGEILDSATYRNTELWQQYPEYHELSYTVDKNGKAKAELVRQYGSWGEAVAEARKHGVKLRQEEGHRDGNPAEEYEAIVNDTRAVGGTKQGAAELFRGAAKAAGVDGAASMESTEWLDVLMNVHDTIKPKMMSRFADVAEYEDAKVELAGRMIGDLLHVNEMNDAQAIFDSFQKWQRRAAAAAAGDETSAAKAVKDLRAVQKEQTREFNRRLAENQKAGNQSEAVQQMQEQQRRNAKAEAMLDANLDALGVDITNSGDMAEKLDVLKEAYEREWRAEKKRLKEERQQMLDEITLENKTLKAENRDLARQVANEQRRADRAEYSQIVQEREIMEWEAENQKKAEAWQQKQAQKNAIAVEVARQQRDEDIAVAKALAEKRVQRARDGRKADELKRSIRNNAAQLNQMILRPSKGKYVQPRLIQQAAEVAKLADMAVLNDAAVRKLTALANTISQTQGTASDPSSLAYDWEQTGVPKLIQALQADMMNAKQAKLDRLHQQQTEAEALGDGEKAEMLRDRLKARIRETENRTYLPMTVEQLRMLKAITAGTLHVIRTENKTLSLAKTEEIDAFAQKAGLEVLAAKGNETGRIRDALTKYNLDMLGAKRVFRMLGGYTKNGQMEKLADMLNDGQRRQTEIIVEGTKLFDNVTGKANLKQMERFAGPGAELVDIGLKDTKGHAVPLTHGQLCSLYMHSRNADSREHLLNGGLTLPDTTLYNKGDIERAYQKGQTVKIGMLTGADGMPMADTILNTVENALTDYDRKWIEDMKGFFGDYTTNLINETSMKLVGFQRATVKNYYPIAVDKTQLASEIEGVKMDATIEGRGFLKERVKSGLPILLEECSSVVQRSLRDTAAYAGLAAPIRDANRILNANVETKDGIQKLKSGMLKEHWGRDAVNYVDYLLTDLQTKQRKRSDSIGRVMGKLRGNYAGAILTLNPGVAIAQAASLPTAGAVLGSDTMAAVLPFVKNLSGKQLAALKAEIREHGDALLQYRLRGSQRGELASIGVSGSFAEKAMDKLPKSVTGWINKMDEITVAALWEGAKHYVEHHAAEFADGAATKGSDAYWKAVNRMYQKVIEETQPNYTVMQRAGIQRSDNEITKTLTMFTTQRFQNYGILADAVMDYNAQRARYNAEKSAENKTEVQRAGQSLRRAAASQVVQTAVFALMKIGADFLLHRWDREQDENGDVTAESLWNRFAGLFTESAAGNFLFGSEIYSMVGNAVNGTDYDVVSATNISAVNDLFAATTKLYTLIRKDTTGMDEEELEAYHRKLRKAGVDVMEYGLDIAGIPAANGRKMVEAFAAYADDVQGLANGEGFSLNGTPASAIRQYDRLFNAIERGDAEEAAAALGKLDQMGKSDKVSSELKKRLKNYDPDIETAAEARNAVDDKTRQKATKDCIRELYAGLGIREGVKEDAAKREAIIDLVTGAVDQKADELLAGDKDRNVYDDLTDALETGRAKDVQSEVNRLLTAGKKADAIQTKITGVVKSEYLAGNSHDREKLAAMLLRLEADGEPLYEEKDFESWVKQDKKKQEAAAGAVDEWAEVR